MVDDYGRRLMPNVLHLEAIRNPERIFAVVAKSNDISDGFLNIAFQQVASAVDNISYWLQSCFEKGNQPSQHPTLTYIGVPDLRYNILFYAAIQCRYKVFFPSPRNPTSVNTSLLEQTSCTRLVYSVEVATISANLQSASKALHCEQFPALEDLLSMTNKRYPYDLSYADAHQEPILILHSSGSTGRPKPVVSTHGTFATCDIRDWPTIPGRINHDVCSTLRFSQPDSFIYDVFPPFHLAGFFMKVMVPVYNLTPPIFGPPGRPASGALVAQIMRLLKPRAAILPPSIIEQVYNELRSKELLKQLDVLLYAGGPLPSLIGSELCGITTLCQFYGSTEIGQIRQLIPQPKDWAYLEFHPNESFELQPSGDGLFELMLISGKHLEKSSMFYHNYPDLNRWHTKDLFEPHPSKPGLWKFQARTDDILVFSSGEKLNPLPMETSMTAVRGVTGALVVGQGYPQSALLIELIPGFKSLTDVREDLWPFVEAANALLPKYGQIERSMVIIADPDKPFQRAGKGTAVRKLTEDLYTTEIQHLYQSSTLRSRPVSNTLEHKDLQLEDVKSIVHSIINDITLDTQLTDDDENLYMNGLDSIKTAEVLKRLKASFMAVKAEADYGWLSLETIYLNPTVNQLTSTLLSSLNNNGMSRKRDRVADMQAKIAKYVDSLPQALTPEKIQEGVHKSCVAVTGTTGFLGGHLLKELADSSHVSRIYCLNRSPTAQEKFKQLEHSRNIDVVFLKVDFTSHNLGLNDETYNQLSEDCDLIVHNAWRVDFNLSLDSFEDNLQSVRRLVELSAQSPRRPRLMFISSISATGVWAPQDSPRQTIPEAMCDDLSTTLDIGYAESKRVAEHVLDAAASRGIPVTIIRMGQIAPSHSGTWPANDIVPVFLRTCKASGLVASDFVEKVDWVPVDQGAAVVTDLVQDALTSDGSHGVSVYNVVNPREQRWSAMMDTVRSWCGKDAKVVDMREWIRGIEKFENGDTATLTRLPALRMLAIFKLLANCGPWHEYATDELVKISSNLTEFDAVDPRHLESWLRQLEDRD